MTESGTEFRNKIERIIKQYLHREAELKAIVLIWETTTFGAPNAKDGDPLPSKIPVLIGPTSTGKTFTVREMAKCLGAFMKVLLLQQENPDEVAGFMVPVGVGQDKPKLAEMEGYYLRYSKPEWFKELEDSPSVVKIVFLDELDKAPKELVAPMLTFMRDKLLRKWHTPLNTFIIAAMNPTEQPFYEALVARCVFIPWLHNKDQYGELFPDLAQVVDRFGYKGKIILPALPKEPDLATLHFLDVAKKHPWFWDEGVREILIRGMLAPDAAAAVLRTFKRSSHPMTEEMIKDPVLTRKVIQMMNEEDVFTLYKEMHPMFCHQDSTETLVFGEFMHWAWEDATGKRAYRFQRFLADIPLEENVKFALHAQTWKKMVKPKINGDCTPESFKKSLVYKVQVRRWAMENSTRRKQKEA